MNTAPSNAENIRTVVLHAGDFYFGSGLTRISTLLGSCVSITLWHPRKHIGGMCHYMMDERPLPADAPLDGRYAAEAFALFLQNVALFGTKPSEYQAKLFGGGNMFNGISGERLEIGGRNVECGQRFLSQYHIPLISSHVGGSGRRKLHFDLWSGDVWLAFPEGEGAAIHTIKGRKKHD